MYAAATAHDRGTLHLITPPAGDVVALDLARQHLRQDQDFDDAMIAIYLRAAAESVENLTGRALLPQVWEYRIRATVYGGPYLVTGCRIRLPLAPLLEVVSVTVGGEVEAPAGYFVEAPSGPTCGRGSVEVVDGWASGDAAIRFRAGYASAAHVPAALQAACLLSLGSLYENREAEAEKSGSTARMLAENPAFMRLIRPYQLIG